MFQLGDPKAIDDFANELPVFTNLALSEPFEIIDEASHAVKVHLFARPLTQLPEDTALR
jgi:hypothetical protein